MDTALLPGQHWYAAHRADARARALYLRHYSRFKRKPSSTSPQFVSPGECMVLLTVAADAVFVWHLSKPGMRLDGQCGVNCAIFRNEGDALSSALVREADALAWERWPEQRRHFTHVDPGQVRRKRDPGRCFRKAGWRLVRDAAGQPALTQRGLLLLECYPEWAAQEGA